MSNLWNMAAIRPQPQAVLEGDTLPAMFRAAVRKRGDGIWLRQKHLGLWRAWSWNDVDRVVREIGNGLLALGLQPGDVASMLSNTVVEWVLADLAVLCCGGVVNGIYPTDAPSQVQYLCADSRTTVLFVEDDEQLDKALAVRESLPALRRIVVFDMEGLADLDDPGVMSLDALRAAGREYLASHPGALDARSDACKPDDLAILVYTSGTTGKPKGAMHTHRGILHSTRGYNLLASQDERDERMCFLPLCHIAERLGGEYFGAVHRRRSSTSSRTPRRCPKTCARSRRPSLPPCRACGRSSIRR